MTSDLDRLRKFFDVNRPAWLTEGYEGRWAAIGPDEQIVGFFDAYGDAYLAAAAKYGAEQPFLLQQVLRQDRLEQIQLLSWS